MASLKCERCGGKTNPVQGRVRRFIPGVMHEECLRSFLEDDFAKAQAGTVQASSLSTMFLANDGVPDLVIDLGILKRNVGIGWVEQGPASPTDYSKYPVVDRRIKY